jgi:hypothetical protein
VFLVFSYSNHFTPYPFLPCSDRIQISLESQWTGHAPAIASSVGLPPPVQFELVRTQSCWCHLLCKHQHCDWIVHRPICNIQLYMPRPSEAEHSSTKIAAMRATLPLHLQDEPCKSVWQHQPCNHVRSKRSTSRRVHIYCYSLFLSKRNQTMPPPSYPIYHAPWLEILCRVRTNSSGNFQQASRESSEALTHYLHNCLPWHRARTRSIARSILHHVLHVTALGILHLDSTQIHPTNRKEHTKHPVRQERQTY